MIDYDLEINHTASPIKFSGENLAGWTNTPKRSGGRRVTGDPGPDYKQLATNKLLLTFLIQSSVTMCPISSRVHPAVIGD